MNRLLLIVVVAIGVGWAPAQLRAEDIVKIAAAGEAEGASRSARTKAIDKAFARAVTKVLADVLSPRARKEHRKLLRDEVVRRARLYVSGFEVLDERMIEGETRVQIQAKIDRSKLRDALAELGIEAGPDVAGKRPKMVLLLKYTSSAGTVTTFGKSDSKTVGNGGAAGSALAAELRASGFELVSAVGAQAPVSSDADSKLPLDDDAAIRLAKSVGAGGAFIVGVETAGEGRIRGTGEQGAVATTRIRVLDTRADREVVEVVVKGAGFGSDGDAAEVAAARDSVVRAMTKVANKAVKHWPPSVAVAGLSIEITGAKTWSSVGSLIVKLAATKGIIAVHPLDVRRNRVVLAVEASISPKKVLAAVRAARLKRGSVSAKLVGDSRIQAKIRGDARFATGND